jgi:CBS domain-containing protein
VRAGAGFRFPDSIMTISEFCRHLVVCATPEATVTEAAALMRQHHVGAIVICEQRAGKEIPVGIVTDRDIVIEVIAPGVNPSSLRLRDLRLAPLVTIEENASYAQTVAKMSVEGVRRMPVVKTDGTLAGIITLDDVLWQLAEPLAALGGITGRGRELWTLRRD